MLENFFRPKLDGLFDEHGAENVWFQQDGATAHTSRHSLGILKRNASWTCCLFAWWHWVAAVFATFDPKLFFSLWGYLKALIYQHRPQTLEDLKDLPFRPKWPAGSWNSIGGGSISVSTTKAATWVTWFLNFRTALRILFKFKKKIILLGLVFISFPNQGVLYFKWW
jgi:hypothetical protein